MRERTGETQRVVERTQDWLLNLLTIGIYAFLMGPIVLIVLMALNAGELLEFPPKGISLRWFVALYQSEQFMTAIITSLQVASIATVLAGLLGTTAAIYYVRFARRLREPLRILILGPLLLPEILSAIALLFFLYQVGLGTKWGVGLQIGHTLVTLPYVFLNVSTALHNFDPSLEQAARSLGSGPWTAFRRITLPLVKSGLFAGCMFAFVISFDLFAMSLLLKGIGQTTLPVQLYDYLRWDFDPIAAAVSSVSIAMTLMIVLLTDRIVGLKALRF
jgi:putative spermidine/putrescine transport system permease protein